MRVLLLSKYDRLGASSRVRSLQYLPYLEAHDVDVTHRPLFGDAYVRSLYAGRRRLTHLASGYLRRVRDAMLHRRFDLVWLEKELLPWLPEGVLSPRPYVVDYDDAIFHNYDAHRSRAVRACLGHKIDHVMRRATTVIAGNEYIARRAEVAKANRIAVIPTAVDLRRYEIGSVPQATDAVDLVIGWIGTPVTTPYVREVLDATPPMDGVRYRLVGAERFSSRPDIDWVTWSETDEVEEIRRFDVGIMPLPDTPFERGKCGYKLIQYMACAKPVLASPVGVNTALVDASVGVLVADGGWRDAIATQRSVSREARARMGAAGRRRVESDFSTDVTGPALLEVLLSAP